MENRFFSVRQGVKINGAVYRPGICYPLNGASLERSVAALIASGDAAGYPEEVRFITGRPVPVRKAGDAPAGAKVQGRQLTVPSSASRARKSRN